jgi:DNA-binding SARP family transcriptional activator
MPGAADPLAARVTVVLAAAGYGKTTAVRGWLGDRAVRWLRGPECSGDPALTVADGQMVVIDDAHLIPRGPMSVALGPGARAVLITRRPLPPDTLAWTDSPPVEIGPAQLALPAEAAVSLLRRTFGIEDTDLARRMTRLTGGWPALVEMLAAALVAGPGGAAVVSDDQLVSLATAGSPLADFVLTEVLAEQAAAARRLLTDAVHLGSITADLAAELGHRRPRPAIAELARLGIVSPLAPGHASFRPVPLLAAIIGSTRPRPDAERRHRLLIAADWCHRARQTADELRMRVAAGDHDGCARLLTEHGSRLVAAGAAPDVLAAIAALPPDLGDGRWDLLRAEALDVTGDSADAVEIYASLAGRRPTLPPGLAWRYGAAVYMWREPRDALDVLRRGQINGGDTADEAMLLAWTASAHWLGGDLAACRDHATSALRVARAADDKRALAAAHVALGLCADLAGDPAELRTNYARALALAEAAGDVVQSIRIRTNLAAALEREARYDDALDMLRPAVALAEQAGHVGLLAIATANQAALLHRTGRLDEASDTYLRSIEAYQRLGSRKVAWPLCGLGDIHRQRGRRNEARAAYEEALRAATDDGNRQGLVPALAGLARAVAPDDPHLAVGLAARALEQASGPLLAGAHLAAGYAALESGSPDAAREHALAAAASARDHRDRGGLAEALELQAATAADPRKARQALIEALAIWRDAAARLDVDRVTVALGRLAHGQSVERLHARLATGRLTAAGVIPPVLTAARGSDVEVRVLGGFTVLVDGAPAPTWQSRKARDLLRILVARRGRMVSRDELCEMLWGEADVDAEKLAHRLAVALSTVRGMLDPGRRAPQDHFITSGPTSLCLNVDRATVDVEVFLAHARHALRLGRDGADDDARAVLLSVEQMYVGEVFADDPYDEWARPLRAEAHAVHLSVLRALVTVSRRRRDPDEATAHLRRILLAEPYDEQSYRLLIGLLARAGRHGEARRTCDAYMAAMREIGVPTPDPAEILGAHRLRT